MGRVPLARLSILMLVILSSHFVADHLFCLTRIFSYQGIFFSKSRREEVVEVDEEPEYVLLPAPLITPNPSSLGPATGTTKTKLVLLSQADFMRGCPEASEQSHLFSLYNKLSEPERRCPNYQNCGGVVKIKKSDFVAIYVRKKTDSYHRFLFYRLIRALFGSQPLMPIPQLSVRTSSSIARSVT